MPSSAVWWRHAAAGLVALLVGIGFARFGYTPLIPALIEADWLTPPQAAYLGAANLAGYFAGSLLAAGLARRAAPGLLIRASLVVTVLSFAACALPWGFWWFFPWRFASGFTGAVIMVLALPLVFSRAPADRRARASGLVFTGVGLGVVLSGTLLPVVIPWGVAAVWFGFAGLGALAVLATWPSWRDEAAPTTATAPAARAAGLPILLLFIAYALDGAAFVPHTVFWVDFIARGLERGVATGSQFWIAFGIGALIGPLAAGFVAEKIGFALSVTLCYALKAAAIALPLVATTDLALALSPLIVGALTPGGSALLSGRIAELAGLERHRAVWGGMTGAFAFAQAAGGYGFSYLFEVTYSYGLLFALGAGMMLLTAALCAASAAMARR